MSEPKRGNFTKEPNIQTNVIHYDNCSKIQCATSNTIYSCSTILLYGFPQRYGSYLFKGIDPLTGKPGDNAFSSEENSSFEAFMKEVKEAIERWDQNMKSNSVDTTFNTYAFVTASVREEQGLIAQYLDRLGFMGTPWVWNTKNKTNVRFFIMPMPEFIAVYEDVMEEKFPKGAKQNSDWSIELNDWGISEEVIELEGAN